MCVCLRNDRKVNRYSTIRNISYYNRYKVVRVK